MIKKIVTVLAVVVLIVSAFFLGYRNRESQEIAKGGLKVYSWSSGIGSVNELNLDKTSFSYSISLTNENPKETFLKSYELIPNGTIKDRVISHTLTFEINKTIQPYETIQIEGEIILDTTGMSKQGIIALEPFITGIRLSTHEIINLSR
jgi:hypothetical protein